MAVNFTKIIYLLQGFIKTHEIKHLTPSQFNYKILIKSRDNRPAQYFE